MIVTINTDASFSKEHQRGSFAFWIVCDKFKILKSGILRRQVIRPEVAEFKCIINALHILLNENISTVTRIVINTDCLNVIHLINNDKKEIKKYQLAQWGNTLVETFKRMREENEIMHIPITMKHVKSHSGIGDARSYVNEWCDTQAKLALKRALNLS